MAGRMLELWHIVDAMGRYRNGSAKQHNNVGSSGSFNMTYTFKPTLQEKDGHWSA
jgi:hypothetical protein